MRGILRLARKAQIVGTGVLILAALRNVADAELLHYDAFLVGSNPSAGEYTLGQLAEQNPTIGPVLPPFLEGPWSTRPFPPPTGHVVQSGPITGVTFFPTQGGSVRADVGVEMAARAGRHLDVLWDDLTVGTYYLSFLVNFGASEHPADGMGFRSLEFWNAGGTIGSDRDVALTMGYSQFSTFGFPQNDPSTARMAVKIGGTIQVLPDAPESFNEDGLAHFVVMEFELNSHPLSDVVSIYLNPNPFTPIPSVSFSGIDFTLGAIGLPSLFGGTGRGTEFDEIRIGTEYNDVIPVVTQPPTGACSGDELGEACYTTIIHEMNALGFDFEGDLNNDGRVDLYDLRIWRDNRTDGLPQIVSLPEPETLVLVFGLVAICCKRN